MTDALTNAPREVLAEHLRSEHSIEWGVNGLPLSDFIPTGSCHLAGTQVHAGGTHVLTVKGVAITGGQST